MNSGNKPKIANYFQVTYLPFSKKCKDIQEYKNIPIKKYFYPTRYVEFKQKLPGRQRSRKQYSQFQNQPRTDTDNETVKQINSYYIIKKLKKDIESVK